MLIAQHSIQTNLDLQTIWQQLIKVEQWKDWDETIEFAEMEEPIEVESIGIIKHKNYQPTSFIIAEYKALQKLVEIRKSYFGKFKITKEIDQEGGTLTRITQKIEILDPQSVIFSPFISKELQNSLAQSIRNLLHFCKGTSGVDNFEFTKCAPESPNKRRTNSSSLWSVLESA